MWDCLHWGEQAGPLPEAYWRWELVKFSGWTLEYIASLPYLEYRNWREIYAAVEASRRP